MSMLAVEDAEPAILARVIGADLATLPPMVAEEFLKWRFPDDDQQRMTELAAKARQGALSKDEQALLDRYEHIASFLGVVKSKARRSLQSGQLP